MSGFNNRMAQIHMKRQQQEHLFERILVGTGCLFLIAVFCALGGVTYILTHPHLIGQYAGEIGNGFHKALS
jgi:hypothetical protein